MNAVIINVSLANNYLHTDLVQESVIGFNKIY